MYIADHDLIVNKTVSHHLAIRLAINCLDLKSALVLCCRNAGSRQNTPTDEEQKSGHVAAQQVALVSEQQKVLVGAGHEHLLEPHQQALPQQLHLDAPQFEPMGIDTIPFDYASQLMPSMDSPSFGVDYNQQVSNPPPPPTDVSLPESYSRNPP